MTLEKFLRKTDLGNIPLENPIHFHYIVEETTEEIVLSHVESSDDYTDIFFEYNSSNS